MELNADVVVIPVMAPDDLQKGLGAPSSADGQVATRPGLCEHRRS